MAAATAAQGVRAGVGPGPGEDPRQPDRSGGPMPRGAEVVLPRFTSDDLPFRRLRTERGKGTGTGEPVGIEDAPDALVAGPRWLRAGMAGAHTGAVVDDRYGYAAVARGYQAAGSTRCTPDTPDKDSPCTH
ncbi:hypothetical protein [Actinoplanes regularis]|uniref:hypothetical protein n=1 Tax=Actinoplanes regularis TaxID=52697 RepID=UPI0025524696|nr:hypothetical protein [Actinoplanes regularis]